MSDPAACERLARRLARLFRIERKGGFDALPPALVPRLLARRAALIEQLVGDCPVQGLEALDTALSDLAAEVRQSQECVSGRLGRLELEALLRCGRGRATGVRRASGQLLGWG
jgi:hypothetical protein